jgi:hypothetical protein
MKPSTQTPPISQTTTGLKPWKVAPSDWVCRSALTEIAGVSSGFSPIGLTEMDDVALLDRVDVKFMLTNQQLLAAMAALQDEYWILEVAGKRLNHYRTLYFDTPRFDLYYSHVNERPERYKVRSREYTDTHLSFLEVKHRTRKDRTLKDRIPTAQPAVSITSDLREWLRSVSPLDGTALEPVLWNTFTRMTLVSRQRCERVTLDVDLAFTLGDQEGRLDGIAVAEVKLDGRHQASRFLAQMRRERVREQGFSKYAYGVAALGGPVKKNALKPKMLWVERMRDNGWLNR